MSSRLKIFTSMPPAIRFLADESCDAIVVRMLRSLGYDVTYIAESSPGITDDIVLTQSLLEERLLLTEDRDFCELVFRDGKSAYGIILIRIPARERHSKAERLAVLVREHGDQLPHAMTTLSPTAVKIRPIRNV